ncbi:hypothetical protein GGI05_006028, partial [Coemansia sp. RSA 2603]
MKDDQNIKSSVSIESGTSNVDGGMPAAAGAIGAGTEFEGAANATLTGVKKKLVTEWRRSDK